MTKTKKAKQKQGNKGSKISPLVRKLKNMRAVIDRLAYKSSSIFFYEREARAVDF